MTNEGFDVNDRRVDLGLGELAGSESPPDLTERVIARVAGAAGAPPIPGPRPVCPRLADGGGWSRARWLVAAVVLLGLGVLAAVAVLDGRDESDDSADIEAQDPIPPVPENVPAVHVRSLAEAEAMAEGTRRVVVYDLSAPVLEALARHTSIELFECWIDNSTVPANDAALEHLAKLVRLRKLLIFVGNDARRETLRALAGIPMLTDLAIYGQGWSVDELDELARFPNLRRLALRSGRAPGGSLAFLEGLPRLQHLDLQENPGLTASDLQPLRHLKDLQTLNLHFVVGMARIFADPPVEHVDRIGADDSVLKVVGGLSQLERLNLYGLHAITDDGMKALSGLDRLRFLDVSMCTGLTAEGFTQLPTGLTTLVAAYRTQIDGRALERLPNLKVCVLRDVLRLTNDDVAALARGATKLEALDLDGCNELTDGALPAIGRLTTLRELMISGIGKLTAEGIEQHLAALKLEKVYIPYHLRWHDLARLWPGAEFSLSR